MLKRTVSFVQFRSWWNEHLRKLRDKCATTGHMSEVAERTKRFISDSVSQPFYKDERDDDAYAAQRRNLIAHVLEEVCDDCYGGQLRHHLSTRHFLGELPFVGDTVCETDHTRYVIQQHTPDHGAFAVRALRLRRSWLWQRDSGGVHSPFTVGVLARHDRDARFQDVPGVQSLAR